MPLNYYHWEVKKGLVFLVEKTLKGITYHSLKLAKIFSQLSHSKPIPYFMPMLLRILEPSGLVRNLHSP